MTQLNEVAKLAKHLGKLQNDDFEDTDRALDLLKQLKECPMNVDILTKTRIGLIVNNLRKKTENQEVASLGKKLIKLWKKFLPITNNSDAPKRPKTGGAQFADKQEDFSPVSKTEDNFSNREEPNQDITPTSVSSMSYREERTFIPESVGNNVRDKIIEMLLEALKRDLPNEAVVESNFFKIALEIEECIFNEFNGETGMKYKNRARSRISNLKDAKNPYLRQRVLSGQIEPEVFAKMTAEEMASEELKKKIEQYFEASINNAQRSKTAGTKTDLFKCTKCRGNNCSYTQLQTRSADEPMTTFVWCNSCGNRWKFC